MFWQDNMQINAISSTEEILDRRDRRITEIDLSWLPLAAQVYHISPDINDYILVSTLICPSDLPNRNGIAFPLNELIRFAPPPNNRMAYKGWQGCPIFKEHKNDDPSKAYGVILDVCLTKITGYADDKLYKVMGILAIDKTKYPETARRVLSGEVNTYSMGALADYFTCSYCGEVCSEKHCCSHITSIQNVNFRPVTDYDGATHLIFLNAHGLSPIETSIVEDPAWAPALSDNVIDLG